MRHIGALVTLVGASVGRCRALALKGVITCSEMSGLFAPQTPDIREQFPTGHGLTREAEKGFFFPCGNLTCSR
jgi:hypothetical protein